MVEGEFPGGQERGGSAAELVQRSFMSGASCQLLLLLATHTHTHTGWVGDGRSFFDNDAGVDLMRLV